MPGLASLCGVLAARAQERSVQCPFQRVPKAVPACQRIVLGDQSRQIGSTARLLADTEQ